MPPEGALRSWFENRMRWLFEVDPDIRFSNRSRWVSEPLVLNLPEAGFPIDEALEAIRAFIHEAGTNPNQRSWKAAGMAPCEKTIRTRFGSFTEAVRAARSGSSS